MLWVEKHRPKEFADVVGLPAEIQNMLGNLPHLLFLGKPGTGKTTTAKIIVNKLGCDFLLLNASDERGIQVIRDKVKSFAMTLSSDGKLKIVFLDEFDALTSDAQNSLRNLMETYHNNVRFICTANYENKIIDALKSRFTVVRFNIDDIATYNYLQKICVNERFELSPPMIQSIIQKNNGDIRKCVNQMQRLFELKRPIMMADLTVESELPDTIHQLLKAGDFISARQILLDANIEYDAFLVEYHSYIIDLCINKKQLSGNVTGVIINHLADAISKINFVISKEIIVESFMLKIIGVLKQNA